MVSRKVDTPRDCVGRYDPDVYKQQQLKQQKCMCSEVIANALYISGYEVAKDREALRRHGITHIVNTAADACDDCFKSDVAYCSYYLKDSNSEDISVFFYRTIEWMHDAILQGGKVLVHCVAGVSRSSTMVIAYMMWRFDIPFDVAHERVQQVRPTCNPNVGFTCQLLLLGKKLSAARANTAQPSSQLCVFRVAPHHAKEPFLFLRPVPDFSPAAPAFDPRFVWVLRRGDRMVCWVGSRAEPSGARDAVRQCLHWATSFERCSYSLTEMQEGAELPCLWEMLGLSEPADHSRLSAPRPAFDADAEALRAAR